MEHEQHAFMIMVGVAIAIGGWFFKRIFKLLDEGAIKMNETAVEIARLKTHQSETQHRLNSIEKKIDRLLER